MNPIDEVTPERVTGGSTHGVLWKIATIIFEKYVTPDGCDAEG
jgi:hypothetical protein